jgi:hypothetical protein
LAFDRPAAEIEQLVTSRMRQWLLDPPSIYKTTRFSDASAQCLLVARAAEIGKSWPELAVNAHIHKCCGSFCAQSETPVIFPMRVCD